MDLNGAHVVCNHKLAAARVAVGVFEEYLHASLVAVYLFLCEVRAVDVFCHA